MPQNRDKIRPSGIYVFAFLCGWLVLCLAIVPSLQPYPEEPATLKTPDSKVDPGDQLMLTADELKARWTSAALLESTRVYEKAYIKWIDQANFSDASLALSKMGDAFFILSEYSRALEKYKQAATLAAKAARNDDEANALSQIGRLYSYMGNQREAKTYLRKALRLTKTYARIEPSTLGHVLSALGEVSYAQGDFVRAATQFEEARKLLSEDRKSKANVHLFAGYIAGSRGQPDIAETEITQALRLFRYTADKRGEGLSLAALGLLSSLKRDEDRAINLRLNAITILASIGDRHSEAIARNGLAQSYENLADYSSALENYGKALELLKTIGAVDLVAVTTFHVARVHHRLGDLERALVTYEECLKLSKAGGKERTEAHVRSEIAAIHAAQGNTRQSLDDSRKLLQFYLSIGDRQWQAITLISLGDSLVQLGKREQALATYRKALEVSERSGDTGILISTLYSLARVHRNLGSNDLALSFVERSLQLIEDLTTNLASVKTRTSYFAGANQHYELCIDILMRLDRDRPEQGFAGRALLMSERSRARALLDLISQSSGDPSHRPPPVVSLSQIQAGLLDRDTLLLEYSLGAERSYLWTVTFDSLHSYELPGRKEIEAATRELYELVTSRQAISRDQDPTRIEYSDSIYREKARKLSQLLLGRVSAPPGTRRLLIAASGALQYLPFEALPVPDTHGKSLLEEFEVVRLPSVSTLMAIRLKNRPSDLNRVAAVIADPILSRNDDRMPGELLSASAANSSLNPASNRVSEPVPPRLSYASEEVQAISSTVPASATMLTSGFEASRQNILSSAIGEYQIIHFATHSFANSERPEWSGILLTRVDKSGNEIDGVMSLHDIYGLELNANLTVLSACQTALGKDVRGEGLIGLSHGFLSAGSKSVVSSLWKVDDRATAYLMTEFYGLLLKEGMTPSEALRQAKLKMMRQHQWQAPYYWAGFVLQGEYSNRIVVGGRSWSHFYTVLLICGVVAISFLVLILMKSGTWHRKS